MNDSTTDFEAVYDGFITTVRQSGAVWGLFSNDTEGWATCPSAEYEDTDVLPFWSSDALAQRLCTDEWQIYQPKMIPLDEFINDWLPGMHEDDALVGPDWTAELEGLEIEPADVAAELGWED
ncbi:MAG: DUF2750 domain-containing protein [Thiolinea sp.]